MRIWVKGNEVNVFVTTYRFLALKIDSGAEKIFTSLPFPSASYYLRIRLLPAVLLIIIIFMPPHVWLIAISCFMLCIRVPDVFAAGAVNIKEQRQRQQEQAVQQAMAERQAQIAQYQAAQVKAYQEAQAYQQAQVQAYQAAQVQAYQEEQMKAYQYQQAQVQAYQQAQIQAYQQAQVQAVQKAVAEQMVQARMQQEIQSYVAAQQIQAAQAVMIKQAAEQNLYKQMAQRVGQAQAARVQEEMVARAVAQAVQEAAQQRDASLVGGVMEARNQNQSAEVNAQRRAVYMRNQQDMEDLARMKVLQTQQQQTRAMAEELAAKAMQQKAYEQARIMQVGAQAKQLAEQQALTRPYEPVGAAQVKAVADIADVWQKLDEDSRAWTLLIDNEARFLTIKEYVNRFAKEGVQIHKSPTYYAPMIDSMFVQNPDLLRRPFKEVVQIASIMDYDFDNGTDRDQLARKLLGDSGYRTNKQRLGR